MKAGEDYELAHAEGFPFELGRSPKKVRNAYRRTIVPALKSDPARADPPRIKRLRGYKNLWRLRVSGDYRLVYRVDQSKRFVTILMLDHRAKIYKRLGANPDGTPGVRIVARAEDLLEREPTAEEIGQAEIALAGQLENTDLTAPSDGLPEFLTPEKLALWGVPAKYHEALIAARTEEALLSLNSSIPDVTLLRVLDGLWPRRIEEITNEPTRVAPEPSALEAAAEGERSLDSFLLHLDDIQAAFVDRFAKRSAKGPWLLKGGPGSGKSTVALYCILSLVRNVAESLPLEDRPLQILFTTYTNSLVNASEYLLQTLGAHGSDRIKVHVRTVDSIAREFAPAKWRNMQIARSSDADGFMREALNELNNSEVKIDFTHDDARFLREEVDWVLLGQGVSSEEDYLNVDRAGRGRALNPAQRRQVWRIYQAFLGRLRDQRQCLFSERMDQAFQAASPQYDYIFIDEAQDLAPIGIRFCIRLCHDPKNVFLTADTNQSIYGNGISWSQVASDLQFRGRARVLRRNYRTTTEIWGGIGQLAPRGSRADRETLDAEPVFTGPFPILARHSNIESVAERLNSFLWEALREERVAPGGAAVLCPTKKEMKQLCALIDKRLNPKKMKSRDLDLSHPGVKVLTMHAAKGLQFPIVAVAGVEDGRMPLPAPTDVDRLEHDERQRRLLFVACSRAMRRLILFANRDRPSPFVQELTDEYWQVENL